MDEKKQSTEPPEKVKLKVLLVANYPADQQQSMERFARMMASGLSARGHEVRLTRPEPFFGKVRSLGSFAAKWLGYVDKFLIFPWRLAKESRWADIIHICDHSNSLYVHTVRQLPHLITCHDLLAVRAGLGEETFVQLNPTGKMLQHFILQGLRAAQMIVCDSTATRSDAERLVAAGLGTTSGGASLRLILLGLNYPFQVLPAEEADRRLSCIPDLNTSTPFLLHVGSSLTRKNRAMVIRILARIQDGFAGQVVFAGAPLPQNLLDLADALAVSQRIIQVVHPESEMLEGLYNRAFALVYPSLSEGFGWPIIEAQACNCPVVCSNVGPLPEVAGAAAYIRDPADDSGFAADILKLKDKNERRTLIELGQENIKRFQTIETIEQYERVYYDVLSSWKFDADIVPGEAPD